MMKDAPRESELFPQARRLHGHPFGQEASLKVAADSVIGLITNLSFMGVGAVTTGFLFVASSGLIPRVPQDRLTEGLVADERVTIPVIDVKEDISTQPQTGLSAAARASSSSAAEIAVRPAVRRPSPPGGLTGTAAP